MDSTACLLSFAAAMLSVACSSRSQTNDVGFPPEPGPCDNSTAVPVLVARPPPLGDTAVLAWSDGRPNTTITVSALEPRSGPVSKVCPAANTFIERSAFSVATQDGRLVDAEFFADVVLDLATVSADNPTVDAYRVEGVLEVLPPQGRNEAPVEHDPTPFVPDAEAFDHLVFRMDLDVSRASMSMGTLRWETGDGRVFPVATW